MKTALSLSLVALLALSACDSTSPDTAPTGEPSSSDALPAPSETASATPSPAPTATSTTPAVSGFPAAMQGRWGLVAADCTSQAGDNKGMITVSASEIRFYESIAEIQTVKESSATRLRATLAYEGEGMKWNRDALLQAKPATNQLVLEEFGSDAVPGPRTYTRCK